MPAIFLNLRHDWDLPNKTCHLWWNRYERPPIRTNDEKRILVPCTARQLRYHSGSTECSHPRLPRSIEADGTAYLRSNRSPHSRGESSPTQSSEHRYPTSEY